MISLFIQLKERKLLTPNSANVIEGDKDDEWQVNAILMHKAKTLWLLVCLDC